MNLSPDKMDFLLGMAGKKLGKDPQSLKQQLESGNISEAINGLDESTKNKIGDILKDPKALEAILKSDKAKDIISGFAKGK
ncbi:MAG: hypothetical protein FWH02_09215 [Oscillospiraceae bacterium]|nr:hypothetical protein [Oscillospiraceae bacterium]